MLWFLWLFFLFSTTQSLPYLDNNATTFSWVDTPKNSLLGETRYPCKRCNSCLPVPELQYDHHEADTGMLVHVTHACVWHTWM